jgi:glycosyltransferase involved in cell wall biosynthesis
VSDLRPTCALLLPRPLERFILREQAEDLLRGPDVVALDPPRPGYGATLRVPEGVAGPIAQRQAASLLRRLRDDGRDPRVVVAFHAIQEPVVAQFRARAGSEVWYWRWDRYELAHDAGPAQRERLAILHDRLSRLASLVVASSGRLAELAREDGRPTVLSPLAADRFPAPEPTAGVVALTVGHLGRRVDWTLLRAIGERMPELQLLLVGEVHEDEVGEDPDFRWCREHAPYVFVGRLPDEAVAQLLRLTDAGLLPFAVDPFNDAGLPYRILKAARLGRRTVVPDLAGARTWDRAILVGADADAMVAALRSQAGAREAPDASLRAWALEQAAHAQNAPLRERLRAIGLDA